MALSTIKTSVFDRLIATGGLLPLFFDNVEADAPDENHLRPFVLPGTAATLGLNDLSQESGLIQVSVYVKKGQGDIVSSDTAALILDAFPRNLSLTGLRIDVVGSIAPSFFDGAWQITPVTIPYQNLEI